MKQLTIAAAVVALSAGVAAAGDPTGVWKSEANDEGNYITVKVEACGDKICGTIIDGHAPDGSVADDYPHKGKPIIWDMVADGENEWDDGRIWAPDEDETYSSQMELKGDVLTVEGCVLIICRGQDWTRVN
ncbi:MAG: DUF2147 domain-containing protein [Pseudomonadota bacterium]